MMDFIMVPLIIGIITLGIYKLFELFACRRERMAIIEKLGDKVSTTDLTGNLSIPNYSSGRISSGSLKGGCLMLGVGLGLLIAFFICYNAIPQYVTGDGWGVRRAEIVYGACTLLFGGAGLLTAFLIEMRLNKKNKE